MKTSTGLKTKHRSQHKLSVIVKYRPWLYEDDLGPYTVDEYTSSSDIGDIHEGREVTVSDYLYDESRYINFVLAVLNYENISWLEVVYSPLDPIHGQPKLSVSNIQEWFAYLKKELKEPQLYPIAENLKRGDIVLYNDIRNVLKIMFRDIAHYELANKASGLYLLNYGDMYLYLYSRIPLDTVIQLAAKYGLYVNPRDYIDGYPIDVDKYRIV